MTHVRPIPVTLSVVSYVFFASAILAVFKILSSVMNGSIPLDFDIVGFWICFGLRRYSRLWRTCALVFIWLGIIGSLIAFLIGLFGRASIEILGKPYGDIPGFWFLIVAALFFALELWMYRVLTRPNIRGLFYDESQAPVA
jgi:multisubunit Na+/H+ antiporter MnhF subunit